MAHMKQLDPNPLPSLIVIILPTRLPIASEECYISNDFFVMYTNRQESIMEFLI
jgi:hypothetical protein